MNVNNERRLDQLMRAPYALTRPERQELRQLLNEWKLERERRGASTAEEARP